MEGLDQFRGSSDLRRSDVVFCYGSEAGSVPQENVRFQAPYLYGPKFSLLKIALGDTRQIVKCSLVPHLLFITPQRRNGLHDSLYQRRRHF
jgi:hypothetical protein